MDTLLTEIMVFRELRESILVVSEEDAAALTRISRPQFPKGKGITVIAEL
jgi:hypothetical protein